MAQPTPIPQVEPVTTSRLRPVAFAVLTAALVVLCAVVAAPLLPAITWAIALAVLLWPIQTLLTSKYGRPGITALAMTVLVGIILIASAVFVTYKVAERATSTGANQSPSPAEVVRQTGTRYPAFGVMIQWADHAGIDLDRHLHELGERVSHQLSELARGSIQMVVQLGIALFLLFHLLRDRQRLLASVRALLPLSRVESDRLLQRTGEAVFANLYANGVTSVIDSVAGFLVFWAVGLPSPALWAVIMFVLSLIPPFGASIVWAPAAVYLAFTSQWPGAVVVLVYGLMTWTMVDNVLYARLAGKGMGIHPAVALIAVIGGLAVFGAPGRASAH